MYRNKLTKTYITSYLRNFYKTHNTIPKSTDTTHPFSKKSVQNMFGSWNNALEEANIPKRMNPSQNVICKHCNTPFKKQLKDIKRTQNNFCSRDCASYYNSRNKILSDKSKQQIRKKLQKYKNCIICNVLIIGKQRKTCSEKCHKEILSINGKLGGKKGGIISSNVQSRRSKGEIMFANLCIDHFGKDNILCNALYFKDKNNNMWDADIVIKDLKIAILYNGIWHYKQVKKNHNLHQVQTRDKLKQQIILDNNYTFYIIKDIGKFNKLFVQEQFYLFLHKQLFKNILTQIIETAYNN